MTLVVDATVAVAALVDSSADGAWAEATMVGEFLVAPHLMPVEVANILGAPRSRVPEGFGISDLGLDNPPSRLVD